MKVELDLSDYVSKTDLKRTTRVDTTNLAAKSNFSSWKPEADKIGTDKLKTVLAHFSKPSKMQ